MNGIRCMIPQRINWKKNPKAVNSLAPSTTILNTTDGEGKNAESPPEEMERVNKPEKTKQIKNKTLKPKFGGGYIRE